MIKDCDALNAKIDALGKLLDEREERTKDRFAAVDKLTTAAFNASEKAVDKAQDSNDRHFAQVNEFRNALTDQTQRYLEKESFNVQHRSLTEKVDSNKDQIILLEQRLTVLVSRTAFKEDVQEKGFSHTTTMLIAGAAIGGVVISVIEAFFRH